MLLVHLLLIFLTFSVLLQKTQRVLLQVTGALLSFRQHLRLLLRRSLLLLLCLLLLLLLLLPPLLW